MNTDLEAVARRLRQVFPSLSAPAHFVNAEVEEDKNAMIINSELELRQSLSLFDNDSLRNVLPSVLYNALHTDDHDGIEAVVEFLDEVKPMTTEEYEKDVLLFGKEAADNLSDGRHRLAHDQEQQFRAFPPRQAQAISAWLAVARTWLHDPWYVEKAESAREYWERRGMM